MAAKKKGPSPNPITGEAPNSFTQVTNDTLPGPKNVRPPSIDAHRRRTEQQHREDYYASERHLAPMGYRLDALHPDYAHVMTGERHMFPNTGAEKGTPAINEPHEASDGVTVQRRAEDLSGEEYAKGEAMYEQYGHPRGQVAESLRRTRNDAMNKAVAMRVANGVNESSAQMFYGGKVTTDLPDLDMQTKHEEGVLGGPERFAHSVRSLAMHPEFIAKTPHLSHRERMHAATNMVAQAAADTSPNNKWRDKSSQVLPWPNLDQADASIKAAVENTPTPHRAGRPANSQKASARVEDALDSGDFGVARFGRTQTKAGTVQEGPAKTVAFRGALVDKDSPDAFTTNDIHDGHVTTPWMSKQKAHKFAKVDPVTGQRAVVGQDSKGNDVKAPITEAFEDTPRSRLRGLSQLRSSEVRIRKDGTVADKPEWGKAHVENLQAKGMPVVHAMNDRATREMLAQRGLSRGVNYADNVHAAQGAMWGLEQMERSNVNVSPADEFPVVRHWEGEGTMVPHDSNNMFHSLLNGQHSDNLSVQFKENDRTGRTESPWPTEHDHGGRVPRS